MNIHQNARLTPLGREFVVRQLEAGAPVEAVSKAAGICPRTARNWHARYRVEGLTGLQDRSSRPLRTRQPTPAGIVEQLIALRRQRLPGKEIAKLLGRSPATVSRILKRAGLSRMKDLESRAPLP